MHYTDVLRRPIVTEKSTALQEQGKYTFEVHLHATKHEVKAAVEKVFNVKVTQDLLHVVFGVFHERQHQVLNGNLIVSPGHT